MIQCYSLKKHRGKRLSKNFRLSEFACRDGSDTVFVDRDLITVLQAMRDHFGQPVRVSSGYRTPAHNRAVGGAEDSQHLYGRAADIQIDGVSVAEAAAFAETLLPDKGGIGRYPPKAGRANGWLHIDTRADKKRWVK